MPRFPNRRRGFILVTTSACLIIFLAMVGLATDAGRLYVAHSELQTFADEAAYAAGFELDGTSAGLTRAQTVAASGPGSGATLNHWYFDTQPVSGVTVQFASSSSGPFSTNPAAAGARFVQIQVTAAVSVYFLPVLTHSSGTQNVTVTSIAGQNEQSSLGNGMDPFTPIAHNIADANFGFTVGQLYTIRWPPPGKQNNACPGDSGFTPNDSNFRGYLDVGQGSGSSGLRDAIVNSTYSLSTPLQIGSILNYVSGQKSVGGSIDERFGQDTDLSSTSFATYHGNGRRLLTLPVNDNGSPLKVVGFASFLLDPSPCGNEKNSTACCAEYVGASVLGSSHRGGGTPAVYVVQLIQ